MSDFPLGVQAVPPSERREAFERWAFMNMTDYERRNERLMDLCWAAFKNGNWYERGEQWSATSA